MIKLFMRVEDKGWLNYSWVEDVQCYNKYLFINFLKYLCISRYMTWKRKKKNRFMFW